MKIKNEYKGIGVMSGTSLDGLDISYAEYKLDKGEWFFHTGPATTIPYEDDLRNALDEARELSGEELMALHCSYGKWIGEQISRFIKKNDLKPEFIASHGHTIFHQPENKLTFQIGDGNAIHAETGLPVVFDMRKLDVALGGQGAPLVPVGDALLFSDYDYCLNIGGIANISKADKEETIAYDICAANIVLNHLAKRTGQPYDKDGETAEKGDLIEPLLRELDKVAFYQKKGPKSLGYEHISKDILPLLSEDYITEDLLNTYLHHIAKKVSESLEQLGSTDKQKMLVTGGGARNKFLIKLLKEYCKPVKVEVPKAEIVDYKESIVFGFLGALRLRGDNNVWSHVTGASNDSCSGTVIGHFKEKS